MTCADARGRENGSATVEFALGLPSLVIVLAISLSAISWGLRIEAAQRGAAEAARAAIIESDATATAIGVRVSGEPVVQVARSGGWVTACVTAQHPLWPAVTRCATARDRP